ncbi:hypothetical protein GBAR_LOCUS24867, partial [Geodia barretti]
PSLPSFPPFLSPTLSSQGRGLFGEDGVVLALPDPLQESPLRPPILAHDPTRHISCSPHHAKQKRATNRKMIPQGEIVCGVWSLLCLYAS